MPPKKKEEVPKTVILGRPGASLKMGVVGLPNVGKSSFFNLLTKQNVPAENFPFCTIDPHMAKVALPDPRYDELCAIFKPKSEVPAMLQITDIAGLVKGAAEGQGLGNAFMSHISAVDGIFHMIRAFDDAMISHVEGEVDPIRDLEIIFNELVKKDLETVETTISKVKPIVARGIDKTQNANLDHLLKVKQVLLDGKQIRCMQWTSKEIEYLNTIQLLTAKPASFLVNLSEKDLLRKKNKYLPKIKQWIDEQTGETMIPFSVELEQKLFDMPDAEAKAFCAENACKSLLPRIITEAYHCINLMHFFTAGEDEVKCWTVQRGVKAPQAAGRIHTDMENGFICAEVVHWCDFEKIKDLSECKETGKLRQEGKTYEVLDGDILHFRFNTSKGKK
ncbi:GTP binding protein [Perkinsela sp. CCAP 1560/4]|nr:GTP binding protein [Perkinsela sp. CCAP 1560/4]|eukprot:KNH07283.1 GTP binding protein [Perkinsela sp. CCAP 1560/4]